MQETWVRSLGQEDPLEKEMGTHSSVLAWRVSWREEPGGLQSMSSQKVGHQWATKIFTTFKGIENTDIPSPLRLYPGTHKFPNAQIPQKNFKSCFLFHISLVREKSRVTNHWTCTQNQDACDGLFPCYEDRLEKCQLGLMESLFSFCHTL